MIRVQGALTEFKQCVLIDKLFQILIIDNFDFLNFMGRTEPIEEVHERHTAGNGSSVGNGRQIHDFLYTRFSKHSHTGAAGRHDIVVFSKNGQGVGSNRTGSYMEYTWQ